jgi:hypothetical protein
MAREEDTFEIEDCRCTAETDKAILVVGDEVPDGKVWVPKSQVHDDSEVFEDGTEGTLIVKAWFAEQRGWT